MSNSVTKLVPALILVQNELKPVKKTAENPFFKSSYADLTSILAESQPLLAKNGFAIIQQPGGDGVKISVTTTLLHTSGEWIKGTVTMTPVKSDPQSAGSCITYARRYGLVSLLGIATEDDDANDASQPKYNVAPKTTTTTPSKTSFTKPVEPTKEVEKTPTVPTQGKTSFGSPSKFTAGKFNK